MLWYLHSLHIIANSLPFRWYLNMLLVEEFYGLKALHNFNNFLEFTFIIDETNITFYLATISFFRKLL